jgi:hypothetical protein
MTRDETIALWQRCEDVRAAALAEGKSEDEAHEAAKAVWNAWANGMLEARRALEASGEFRTKRYDKYERYVAPETFGDSARTREWIQAAQASFNGFGFEDTPNFGGFIFPGPALFGDSVRLTRAKTVREPTVFRAGCRFTGAVFHMDAVFSWAQINQRAGFRNVEFRGIVRFDACQFQGTAWFFEAKFLDEVWFGLSSFSGFTNFTQAGFSSTASFNAARVEGAFELSGATFAKLPDFVQTSFKEAPRLDNAVLPPMGIFPGLTGRAAMNEQAKFRAIRRLAVAGNDYENESAAFKGEVRARRGTLDRSWHAAFWFGLLYDVLSDFGRSMMRPFYFWLLSIAAFTAAYLANAGKLTDYAARCGRPDAEAARHWINALALSVKNALILGGADRKMDQQYACLYDGAVPVMGTFIQMGETVWSAILIFLFLLAVRNRFKIK